MLAISLVGVVGFFVPLFLDVIGDDTTGSLFTLKGFGYSVISMCVSLVILELNEPKNNN